MKFIVRRTSLFLSDKPPCEGVVQGTAPSYDTRTFKSFEEHDAQLPHMPKWLERGADHKVMRGPCGEARGISRRIEDECVWLLDIPDLGDLMVFVDEYGECVIQPAEAERPPTLEIYDDYRE